MGHWRLERRDRIAVATFSAPPRNFMTFADMTELEGLVEEVAQDDAITVLVLASDVAGWFVAHGDLEDLLKLGRGEEFDGDALSWPRTLARFGSMPQIVVAAINGQAGGGGLELTLACTLRVVGPRARLTFVERQGESVEDRPLGGDQRRSWPSRDGLEPAQHTVAERLVGHEPLRDAQPHRFFGADRAAGEY